MPKDEFDPEDPMELCGVGIVTAEDTSFAMTECFVEEFMRLGYNHKQILALFRNPHYTGVNMVLRNNGEQFIRDIISEIFAKWGRPIRWPAHDAALPRQDEWPREPLTSLTSGAVDPMGNLVPQEILNESHGQCESGEHTCTCGKKSK
jgi:hypothetical protein